MNGTAGTLRLTRLAARRDRVTLPVWILALTGFLGATTAMFVKSLVTYEDMVQEASVPTTNPGLRMLGLTSGASIGGAVLVRDYVLLSVMAALMSILTVVRHTRQSEELGRAEMIGSTTVGRYADLAAGVVAALAANAVLAVCLALAMVVNGLPVTGAVLTGCGVAAVGAVFTGMAAVTAQLASTARGAIGLAGSVLGIAFLLAGIGNMLGTADVEAMRVDSAWPAWLSPIGWAQQLRPFGSDHWWPLVPAALLLAALLALAAVLVGRRDVGAGLWPQRRGHSNAAPTLLSPFGLVLRLQRGALIGWAIALAASGLIFGSMTEQIQGLEVRGQNEEFYERFGGADRLVPAFAASMASMAAILVGIYVVQIVLRMRADEGEGTLEPLLASGVTRGKWIMGYLLNAVGGALLLMGLFSVGMGLATGAVLGGTAAQVGDMIAAGLVQMPAVLAVGACALAAIAWSPRYAGPLAWGALIVSVLVGPAFGSALKLPNWVLDLSPFTHVPAVPAVEATAPSLFVLTLVCLGLAALAVRALRRRDLVLPV